MILGAVNLLMSQNGNVPAVLKALVVVVFGALLVAFSLVMLGAGARNAGTSTTSGPNASTPKSR
jgi:hypothetical protein